MFDDDSLAEAPEAARQELDVYLALVAGETVDTDPHQHPLRHMYTSIWQRILEVRSKLQIKYLIEVPDKLISLQTASIGKFSGDIGNAFLLSMCYRRSAETIHRCTETLFRRHNPSSRQPI